MKYSITPNDFMIAMEELQNRKYPFLDLTCRPEYHCKNHQEHNDLCVFCICYFHYEEEMLKTAGVGIE